MPSSSGQLVAAIDCGTNTINLLVAELDPDRGAEVERVRETRMVRLGQGVDRTGRLAEEALERVFAAVEEYAAIVADHGVPTDRIRFCATSAARDADNAEIFADGVRARLGVSPEVLPGDEEARLSYLGATRSLAAGAPEPTLVVDIGGGSTELILGEGSEVVAAQSLDIGAVRLTERHLHDDPPSPAQVEAATADIDAALDGCAVDLASAGSVIGVAGTITTTAAMVLDLDRYDPQILDHAVVGTAAVHGALAELMEMSVEERKALPFMHPGRADVIAAGALILDRVLRRAPVSSLLVSEANILDGIAWSMV